METFDEQSVRATDKLYSFLFFFLFDGVQNKMPRMQLIAAYPSRTDLDRQLIAWTAPLTTLHGPVGD